MIEMLRTMKVVGMRPLLRLREAQRLAWPGMINGFYATRIMQTLFHVGFFDEVEEKGSVEPARFAAAHGLDPQVMGALTDAMYALSVLDRRNGGYALSAKGRSLVEVGRGWFDGVRGYNDVVGNLEGLLRKEQVYARDVTRDPVYVARGSGEIESRLYFPLAIDEIRRRRARKVLDLGCGDGAFLRQLCQAVPDVTGCGVDLSPEAIDDGVARAQEAGLGSRIHLFAEDISKLEGVPPALAGVDLATTFFVLHELLYSGAARVIDFLKGFRQSFPGVPLLVFEVDRPTPEQMRKRPGMAVTYYLQHDLSHQKPIAKEAWLAIFESAGFAKVEQRNLGFARSVIFTLQ
jgi:SAM-dependent methyltransferase